MITVTVLSRSTGRPVSGRRITVHWNCSWGEGYSDRNGSANLHGGPGQGKIYISSDKVREVYLSGQVTVYAG